MTKKNDIFRAPRVVYSTKYRVGFGPRGPQIVHGVYTLDLVLFSLGPQRTEWKKLGKFADSGTCSGHPSGRKGRWDGCLR